jgi:pantetheine-phosphate adenylyltransferase
MTTAVYAFSGDPITYGHIDIIVRARLVFDRVIVAIGINPDKSYTFNLQEREEMARKCFFDPAIEVMSFSNLLVDFAYEQGASVIIKGVRNSADFDYESILDAVGKSQEVGIDTHILFADPKLSHISSTVVKSIAKHNGDISNYVPLHVKQAIEQRLYGLDMGQTIIGVTGEIGSGKSYIGGVLSRYKQQTGGYIDVHNIELDHIGHDILCKLTEPAYVKVREEICEKILPCPPEPDGFINREVLGSIVFTDRRKLKILNKILEKPIMIRLRQELSGKHGVILINCALLAEAGLLHLCNNNVILVGVDKDTQRQRLFDRGLTGNQIETRLACQYDYGIKKVQIEAAIREHNHGHLWEIDNSSRSYYLSTEDIYEKFGKIIDEIMS